MENCEHLEIMLDPKTYFNVCKNCGLVVSIQFAEPTEFVENKKRTELAGNLGTFLGHDRPFISKDINNNDIKNRTLYNKLKKIQKREVINAEATILRNLVILNHISEYLHITDQMKRKIAHLYRRYYNEVKEKYGSIKNSTTILASCVRIVTKISIKKISQVFLDTGHQITPKMLIRRLHQLKSDKVIQYEHSTVGQFLEKALVEISNSKLFKERLCYIPEEKRMEYFKLLGEVSRNINKELTPEICGGSNPRIIAITIIYSADQKIKKKFSRRFTILTQKVLSNILQIAESSLRTVRKKIMQKTDILKRSIK
jgi:transcription initiation factor TFIIIB Brf1 subunit/transcription initiation factor TFIIB